jgi:NAD(P)-dependent dehydrogenase (short-subunit alcohol dehydrogenase family)
MTQTLTPASYRPPADLLCGRVILITGAGDGLGRVAALACAQHGATVVLLGRTVSKLEAAYDAIRAAGAAEPAIYPMNLAGATWNDHAELAATLEREFGALHGLVHCAAHFRGFVPLSETDPQDWMDSLQVNLTAPFALTHHCMPLLRTSGEASVVFVSDAAGRIGKPFAGAYGVAKAGIEGLVRIWAQEVEALQTVRINSLDPGPMNTALRRRGYVGDTGAARVPESVVPALLWLLGADGRDAHGGAFTAA